MSPRRHVTVERSYRVSSRRHVQQLLTWTFFPLLSNHYSSMADVDMTDAPAGAPKDKEVMPTEGLADGKKRFEVKKVSM